MVTLQVAVVERGQARLVAEEAAAHAGAGDEHRAGGAVVGAVAGVGRHPPAELGVDRDHHRRRSSAHPVGKPATRRVQLAEQP